MATLRLSREVVGLLLAVATLVGCRSRTRPPAGTQAPRDTIVFATTSDATTLDPAESSNIESDVINLSIYEGLLGFDSEARVVGKLAERWGVAVDGVTWTFHLRRGVRFHDGTALDAAAVKESLDRLRDPVALHRNHPLLAMIARVNVIDSHTVAVVTAFPFGSFEATIANLDADIISPAALAKWGTQYGKSGDAAVGTGPFKLASWKKDLEIVLERNEDYWGSKPRIRRAIYRPVPDADAKVAALEAGDVDIINRIPAAVADRLEWNSGIVVRRRPTLSSYLLRFNNGRRPFNDRRVRQAISLAIDRRDIVDHLMPGTAAVPTGPLSTLVRNSARLGEIARDLPAARRLLREAGYPNGFKTRITTTARYTMGIELAEALEAQLKDVGIDAPIDVIERPIFMGGTATQRAADDREMYIMTIASSTADADWGLRPRFLSSSPINQDRYSNPEFDRVIMQAMTETDMEKRRALYKRAQQIVYLEDPPVLWLFENFNVTAARRQLRDLTLWPQNTVTFERAYLSAEP